MVARRGMPSAETIGAENADVENPKEEQIDAPLRDDRAGNQNCILRCCRCISVVDVIVLGFAGGVSIAGIVNTWHLENFAALGLRGTSMGLCVLLCWEQATRNTSCCKCVRLMFPALDYWVARGFLHLFIALQMEGTSNDGMDDPWMTEMTPETAEQKPFFG
ncbi:ATP-dependent DNA helicase PIF1 [Durusdinium trenchii]|uniref:ATP-dependent DNA helicase PIF1 n=1 Tax=Durusdinium trenchii TaxID=1381693 RepID=A0ABP0SRU5_9DINO